MQFAFEEVSGPPWSDKPTAIVGAGPSLTGVNLDALRDKAHVIAVTSAMFQVPWADVGFGIDFDALSVWWKRLQTMPMDIWWGIPDSRLNRRFQDPPAPNLHFLRVMRGARLSDDPSQVCGGGTSGFAALNFAWLKQARDIVLFGFDFCSDGKGNWHVDEAVYELELSYSQPSWTVWARYFSYISERLQQAGVRVINASPVSTITAFPKVTIEEGLRLLI